MIAEQNVQMVGLNYHPISKGIAASYTYSCHLHFLQPQSTKLANFQFLAKISQQICDKISYFGMQNFSLNFFFKFQMTAIDTELSFETVGQYDVGF